MDRYTEFCLIQNKKEEVERYIYYYKKERVTVFNGDAILSGKYLKTDYISFNEKEPHFEIFIEDSDGVPKHFKYIDIEKIEDNFDGFIIYMKK